MTPHCCPVCHGTGVVWEPRDVLAEWSLTYGRHRGEMKPRYSGPEIDAAVEWRGGGRISATLDSAGTEWTNGGES